MDETVDVLGFYAELLRLPLSVSGDAVAFFAHLLDTQGMLGLLSFCLGDQVFNPALFIRFSLCTIALIDSHHLAKQFALGSALLLGQGFYLLCYCGRN